MFWPTQPITFKTKTQLYVSKSGRVAEKNAMPLVKILIPMKIPLLQFFGVQRRLKSNFVDRHWGFEKLSSSTVKRYVPYVTLVSTTKTAICIAHCFTLIDPWTKKYAPLPVHRSTGFCRLMEGNVLTFVGQVA